MTSDAKIGLLLGLVFIFIIAFIINGLPSFNSNANSSELTVSMVRAQNTSPGLAARERKISREVISRSIRYSAALPKSTSVAKPVAQMKPIAAAKSLLAAKKKKDKRIRVSKPALPKVYVVGEGDSLAYIAKKVYGSDHGNKRASIAAIFNANRKLLKSPDRVYPGQKLVIPALSGSAQLKSRSLGAISASIKSINKKLSKIRRLKTKQNSFYIVKADDSLWEIAQTKLGNGMRYSEIVELNDNIISDEDTLIVGMCLKLPSR